MMDLIFSWLTTIIAEALEEIVAFIMPMFSFTFETFNEAFPFASIAFSVIQQIALAIALIVCAWQLMPFFFGRADKANTTPIRAGLGLILSVAGIYYGNYILTMIMEFAQHPFNAIITMDGVKWGNGVGDATSLGISAIKDYFAQFNLLLYLIMLIMIGISFIKLLLEIVERYVVTFTLVYLSPLAASSLASDTTSGIFKKFFTMFISQCILVFLNIWCLKMALSCLGMAGSDNDRFVQLLMCYAFLRISGKMDTYLNQIGLNSAITGSGLGAELMAGGAMMMGMGKRFLGGGVGGGGSSGGSGSPILGASKTVGQHFNRVNPTAATGRAAVDTFKGGISGASEAFRSANGTFGEKLAAARKGFGHGAAVGFKSSDNLISRTATGRNVADFKNKMRNAGLRTDNATTSRGSGYSEQLFERMENGQMGSEDIRVMSGNYRMAHEAFNHVQANNLEIDAKPETTAVMAGITANVADAEVDGFINVGYGNHPAADMREYNLDAKGFHASYVADGYDHKMELRNHSQFSTMPATEQEGFKKFSTPDGHRYYYKTSRTKREPPPKPDNGDNGGTPV